MGRPFFFGVENKANLGIDTRVPRHGNILTVMESTIRIRIEQKMRRQLENLAEQERRTMSNYVRLLIERAIKESKTKEQAV